MRSSRRNVHETIRDKRQWHTPPDPEATKLGFRGWHSRGFLPHFDIPGVIQMLNYRLDDAMPASRQHEWAALLEIGDELKRRAKNRGLPRPWLRQLRTARSKSCQCRRRELAPF